MKLIQSDEVAAVAQEKAKSQEGEELRRTFDTSTRDGSFSQDLWLDFWYYYDSVMADKKKSWFIHYPARELWLEGIPSPRQVIAWRKFIKMIGPENFNNEERIPLELNQLGKKEPLFKRKYEELFSDSENLEVTFACGFFWKLYPERRETMIDFVVDKMIKKGTIVNIWTQDQSLKRDFKEKTNHRLPRNLHIHCGKHRIDLHYTLVKCKDKNKKVDLKKSHVFMELIHTEAYEFRLETYFPLERFVDIKSFGCSAEKFLRLLRRHLCCNPAKILLSRFFNRALNIV